MFTTKSLFKDITCPMGIECEALNCWFLHDDRLKRDVDAMEIRTPQNFEEKPAKRIKDSARVTPTLYADGPVSSTPAFVGTLVKPKPLTPPADADEVDQRIAAQRDFTKNASNDYQEVDASVSGQPHNGKRTKIDTDPAVESPKHLPIKHTTEALNPRMLSRAPATHQQRRAVLVKLHQMMNILNNKVGVSEDPSKRNLVLAPAQLIKMALDEEEKVAQDDWEVYTNMIRARIMKYQKMTVEEWQIHLLELTLAPDAAKKKQPAVQGERVLETGLLESEERQILKHLIARQDGLERYGYVTGAPSIDEIMSAKDVMTVSNGWELCQRCKFRFQVFKNRRPEDGAFTSGGSCIHHPGRIMKNAHGASKTHNCCNEVLGKSVGCTTADCHVFKIEDAKRLASLLQFEITPDNATVGFDVAFALDCEMGFTVYGFELIRLTVISWPKGEKVIDVLVRPFGDVLDLNTRFSGVRPEQFVEAKRYGSKRANSKDELQIVGSPKEARDLLWSHINPSTPLIGHGLDNDLLALRMVHPCIVDTALLCPHSAGLPLRRSLKSLALDYIHRVIQNAGIAGHDSAEDAKAAGDIVRELVKRKWKKMRDEGWKSEQGQLVPPKILPAPSHAAAEARNKDVSQQEGRQQAEAHRLEQMRQGNEKSKLKRTREDTNDDEESKVPLNYD